VIREWQKHLYKTKDGHTTRAEKAFTAATTLRGRMQHCKSYAAEQWRPTVNVCVRAVVVCVNACVVGHRPARESEGDGETTKRIFQCTAENSQNNCVNAPSFINMMISMKNKILLVYRLRIEAHAAITDFAGRETDNNKCTR